MKTKAWLLIIASLFLAGCDDEDNSVALLGGGPGSSARPDVVVSDSGSQTGDGSQTGGLTTMSSEFGYVDDPAHGGNGDPGTSGNWYTGASGAYIGGQDSTGVSLPLATEVALYGSEQAALGQSVQVTDLDTGTTVVSEIVDVGPGQAAVARGVGIDLTYGTARALGVPVNGSNRMKVTPLSNQNFR